MAARRSACNTVILADSVSQTPLKDLPKPPNSPDSPMPPIDSDGPYCSSAIYHEDVATYKFPIGADLTVMQTTYDNDGERSVNVGIAGEIRLRKLPKGSSTGNQAYITVDVNVSDQNLRVIKTWDHETRILKVATPQYARFGSGQPHCVSLEITAWFPEHAELTDLLIEAIHLNLRVAEDIKMSVSGQSKFASLNGHVAFPSISLLGLGTEFSTPSETSQFIDLDEGGSSSGLAAQVNIPFSSRRIVVETLSGSITGCYPLMDFLGVTSQSGSVKINVFPQPVLPSAPAAAELVIDTIAGSIEVNLPVRDAVYPTYLPPPRNYTTRVQCRSGSIKGSYYLGSISDFRTVAGSIHITTMPVLLAGSADESGGPPNSFETYTVHGGIKVDVLDPVFIAMEPYVDERPERNPHSNIYLPTGDDDPYVIIPPSMDRALFKVDKSEMSREHRLRNLHSIHGSQHGSIRLQYPTVWEGTLHAKTLTSSISAGGEGLRIIEEKKGFASNELLARTGVDGDDEGCFVDMSALSGSLHFLV
jgi:hypothetical protein